MQERFYSVQKACFYVCLGAQANEGVAFLQEIHGTFPFQWRRTGRTFGGPFFFWHLSCPPFFCQTSSCSPCIYIFPLSTNYQKYSKGIWIVVGLAHRCMHFWCFSLLHHTYSHRVYGRYLCSWNICIFWCIAAFDGHMDSALLHQGYRIHASLILHVVHNDKSNFHLAAALCYPWPQLNACK